MPTANANTGNGFSKAVSYAFQEQKQLPEEQRAEVLEYTNVAGTSRDIGRQMRDLAEDRDRVQKPVLHIQINFHPDEKLGREEAEKAVHAILKEVGISSDNHQYVLVRHRDKAHDHYHVVANRIGMDGSLVSNERIIERLQVACDKVEQQQGLRRTAGRTVFYDPTNEKGFRYATSEEKKIHRANNKKSIRNKNPNKQENQIFIKKMIDQVLQDKKIIHPEQFKEALASQGIDVRFMENKNGVSGVSFKMDKISVKGSQIEAKWSDISRVLDANTVLVKGKEQKAQIEEKAPKKTNVAVLQNMIREVGNNKNIVSFAQFKDVLADKGIEVEVKEDKNGISNVFFSSDKVGVEPLETSASLSSVIAFFNVNITTAISNKIQDIETYIEENGVKTTFSIPVVDEAIRTIMLEVNPGANPWETWRTNLEHETLYSSLIEFADKVLQEQKQVSAPVDRKPIDVSIPTEREVLLKEILSDEKVVSAALFKSTLEGFGVSVEYQPGSKGSAMKIHLNGVQLSRNEVIVVNKVLRLNEIISENKAVLLDVPQDFRAPTAEEEVIEKLVDRINGRVDILVDRVESVLKNAYNQQTAIQGLQVANLIQSCGFSEDKEGNFVLKNQHNDVLFRVSKEVILSPLKQFNKQLKEYKTDVAKYSQLMDKKPQKLPLLIGRDKVIQENEVLRVNQEKAVQPKFAPKVSKINRKLLLQETPYRKAMTVHKETFTQLQIQHTECAKKAKSAVSQKQQILSQGIIIAQKQNMRYR